MATTRSGLVLALTLFGCRPTAGGEAVESAAVVQGEGDPATVLERGSTELEPGLRGRALALLIRYSEEPGGGVWGPRALYDPSSYVKRAGVEALVLRLPEEASKAQLAVLVERDDVDPYVRSRAAVELARVGDFRSREALGEAWRAERRHWRRAPLALGAAMMGDEEALPVLVADLSRGDFPLEVQFFLDLGRSGLPGLAPGLIEGEDMLEETLLLPTAVALLQLDDRHGEVLFKEALGSDQLELRMEAVDYLAELNGELGLDLLRRAKTLGPDVVRSYANLVLVARGQQGPEAAFEALGSLDRERRQQAVWALARWMSASEEGGRREARLAYKALVTALGDPEPGVVMAAIKGLGEVGRPAERGLLAGLMEADAVGMRIEAAGAILAIEASAGVADAEAEAPALD